MAGKFAFGEFTIPAALLDSHEWMVDASIDGELGCDCTVIYPNKHQECDNCVLDPNTGRSAGLYKQGGPISFELYGLCPRCNGNGHLEESDTDTVRFRVYWTRKDFMDLGIPLAINQADIFVIGYMDDLGKMERADSLLISSYRFIKSDAAIPWGFRKNRYFAQGLKRVV